MGTSNQELYQKILSFEIDEEKIDFTFSDRLTRENNWERLYSRRCIIEYKKFIYLSYVSNKRLTPSDQVDQVWHLHLTYTLSYWMNLCRDTLRSEFHHGPTKGGKIEAKKYRRQYQHTIELYRSEFGEDPPKDIWPSLDKRFLNADKFIRVNSAEYTILKYTYKYFLFLFLILFLAPLLIYLNGNSISLYIKVIIGMFIFFAITKWVRKDDSESTVKWYGDVEIGSGSDGGRSSDGGGGSADGDGGSGCGGCGGCG